MRERGESGDVARPHLHRLLSVFVLVGSGFEIVRFGYLRIWGYTINNNSSYSDSGNKSKLALAVAVPTADYKNEAKVGEALADAFRAGLVKKEELFITTKLWNSDHGHAIEACKDSLKKLQLDYVDLYLIHLPRVKDLLFDIHAKRRNLIKYLNPNLDHVAWELEHSNNLDLFSTP
ncbi:hypothetical protein Syun_019441 [Stephania yunnanensis]|uniref:NADP-dependent oxidoreductase domain-containing protein n=1 Tax=Stephania yunnanensis TaxID=152371 RepID=A0AAP0NXE6_9MAGN